MKFDITVGGIMRLLRLLKAIAENLTVFMLLSVIVSYIFLRCQKDYSTTTDGFLEKENGKTAVRYTNIYSK